MGLILDTSLIIAGERRGETIKGILREVRGICSEVDIGLSAISVVELTHGIYRAKSQAHLESRRIFVEGVLRDLIVYPVTIEIAKLAGRIEGEQAAKGNIIGFEDLLIGATALQLGFDVATINVRHFERIPGLKIVQF